MRSDDKTERRTSRDCMAESSNLPAACAETEYCADGRKTSGEAIESRAPELDGSPRGSQLAVGEEWCAGTKKGEYKQSPKIPRWVQRRNKNQTQKAHTLPFAIKIHPGGRSAYLVHLYLPALPLPPARRLPPPTPLANACSDPSACPTSTVYRSNADECTAAHGDGGDDGDECALSCLA